MSEPLLEEGQVIFLDGFVRSVPFDRRLPLSFKGLRENLPRCCLQRASGDKAVEIIDDFQNWKAEDIEACLAEAASLPEEQIIPIDLEAQDG